MEHGSIGIQRPASHGSAAHRSGRSAGGWVAVVLMAGMLSTGCDTPTASEKEAALARAKARPKRPSTVSAAAILEQAKEHFAPLPAAVENPRNKLNEAKINLGRMLYYDPRLSLAEDVSCNTCHVLDKFGIDPRPQDGQRARTSAGHQGQRGDRNSPTVYNAAMFIAQFWDGRAKDVEDQAKGPVLNPVEMAMPDEGTVVKRLKAVPAYTQAFNAAFPGQTDPVSYDNMANAIGAFERKLMTPGPFDDFLRGNITALNEQQLRGLELFINGGCIQCHTGPALGGTQFQKLGNVKPWEGLEDEGRFTVTKREEDKFVFKVPSLRNITETAPYLHNGSIAKLPDMVQKMAEHQLARGPFNPEELTAVVAFLGSLKGELPTEYIAKPTLPEMVVAPEPEPADDAAEPSDDAAQPA